MWRILSNVFATQDARLTVAVVVVVEASAPKIYPRVTLASASTLSGSVVRTWRGGEGSVSVLRMRDLAEALGDGPRRVAGC